MKRVRFVAPARAELLAEVAYYNKKELGLGSRFLAVVEAATARALAYPLTGSPASENTRRMFLKDFLSFGYCVSARRKWNSCLCTCSSRTSPKVLEGPHR